MRTDRNGNEVLEGLKLDCDNSWSRYLPKVLDEKPDEVKIDVRLGQTSSFLSYDANKKKLSFDNTKVSESSDDFYFEVQLEDVANNTAVYTVPISIRCR